MSDFEQHNHRQIEMLNQRGGRTLSIVDLIGAGTIGVEMAACAMRAVAEGASLLTGAVPSGAGKTSLMAALLNLLPPGVPIGTVDCADVIHKARGLPADEPVCYLVHEIGAGHWFGYLWGPDVAEFLALVEGPRRIASCLHADTLEELTETLCSPPLRVDRQALGRVGLILFMRMSRAGGGLRRRVWAFHESDGSGRHRLLFSWDPDTDTFRQTADLSDPAGLEPYSAFIQRLVDEGDAQTQSVRRKVVEFYR